MLVVVPLHADIVAAALGNCDHVSFDKELPRPLHHLLVCRSHAAGFGVVLLHLVQDLLQGLVLVDFPGQFFHLGPYFLELSAAHLEQLLRVAEFHVPSAEHRGEFLPAKRPARPELRPFDFLALQKIPAGLDCLHGRPAGRAVLSGKAGHDARM